MKRIVLLCIIVLMCAAAVLLAVNVLGGVSSDAKQTEPQADTNVNAAPAQAGAPADSISEETELFASLSSAAVEQAYKTADGYKELYLKLFSGSGLNLTQDEIAPLAARLGELGCCALALNCSIDMTNPALLNDFFAAVDEGRDADIAIYELCPDAGFLCHTLHFRGGKYYLTRTRLAWQHGSSALQGETPTVTYSETYALTELYVEDVRLCYDYYIPDNPPGTRHDGHIETFSSIYIGQSSG